MSILIKGMDMPNDCCQCKLARYDDFEDETFCPFTDVMCLSIGRQDNCPLEELNSVQPETHDKRTETHACDLIERQAAIDALNGEISVSGNLNAIAVQNYIRLVSQRLHDLPSAQPIVRCKDCKHRDPEDHKCDCGHDIVWQLQRLDDWFCADAERRTDEAD